MYYNLSFNDHIDNIIRKEYRMINIIFRVCICNKHVPLTLAYMSYVILVLEYAFSNWNPSIPFRSNGRPNSVKLELVLEQTRTETIYSKTFPYVHFRFIRIP